MSVRTKIRTKIKYFGQGVDQDPDQPWTKINSFAFSQVNPRTSFGQDETKFLDQDLDEGGCTKYPPRPTVQTEDSWSMTPCYTDGMDEERQATTVRLTRRQLKWVKDAAFDRRCSQQDVIEAALTTAGAPAPEGGA